MIKQYKLTIKTSSSQKITEPFGYYLYGCLSELIPADYADFLHDTDINPVSQFIKPVKDSEFSVWTVNLLGEEAVSRMSFLSEVNTFTLKSQNTDIHVIKREETVLASPSDVMANAREFFPGNIADISFLTTSSFKSRGEYVIFPDAKKITKSLINKWNLYAPDLPIDDADAFELLTKGLKIIYYTLQSRYYPIKGARISGFSGKVSLSAKLAAPLMEIWKLLMYLANYSGIGIKTALGMGGVNVCSHSAFDYK